MTPDDLVGLLAEPRRMRLLAAVALGARTDADTAAVSGLAAKDAAIARQRLVDGGVLVAADDGWAVDYAALRQAARERAGADDPAHRGQGPLGAFVSDRRLRSLPAQQSRRRLVLEHVATSAFEPGAEYDERQVDARLAPWCEGGTVDHVALRRYLVDSGLLQRGGGVYRLASSGRGREPGVGERYVRALGLD